jgi:nickel-type superoxide dismutase maturation protease
MVVIRRVKGHSMMPVLPPETLVLATGWFRRIKPGSVVIFLHEGKEKIKRVEQVEDNRLFVVGDHPTASTDSREIGWIARAAVIAKVFWPHAPKHRAEHVEKP